MECVRKSDKQVLIVGDDGTPLAELTASAADPEDFDLIAGRLALAVGAPPPRIAVLYREGLLEGVAADLPCEILAFEEDRFDEPALVLRRRTIAEPDSASLEALIDKAAELAKTTD